MRSLEGLRSEDLSLSHSIQFPRAETVAFADCLGGGLWLLVLSSQDQVYFCGLDAFSDRFSNPPHLLHLGCEHCKRSCGFGSYQYGLSEDEPVPMRGKERWLNYDCGCNQRDNWTGSYDDSCLALMGCKRRKTVCKTGGVRPRKCWESLVESRLGNVFTQAVTSSAGMDVALARIVRRCVVETKPAGSQGRLWFSMFE